MVVIRGALYSQKPEYRADFSVSQDLINRIKEDFQKMDNETFVARVAQYYTIDDYANYAVIYFKNSEIEPMKQVKLYKTEDPNLAHAFDHYIETFDVKALTEAKWRVNPEYWLEKVITPDLVQQFYVDWLAELKTLQANIKK